MTKRYNNIKNINRMNNNKKKIQLYTTQEVADILRVSRRTVYRLIKSGKLKAVMIGQWRIKAEDLDKFLDSR